jgi:hypothetical protein
MTKNNTLACMKIERQKENNARRNNVNTTYKTELLRKTGKKIKI